MRGKKRGRGNSPASRCVRSAARLSASGGGFSGCRGDDHGVRYLVIRDVEAEDAAEVLQTEEVVALHMIRGEVGGFAVDRQRVVRIGPERAAGHAVRERRPVERSVDLLRQAHRKYPELKLQGLLSRELPGDICERCAGFTNIGLMHKIVTPEVVKAFHDRGIKVEAWCVDDPELLARMIACGVDSVTTNEPEIMLEALRKMAGKK